MKPVLLAALFTSFATLVGCQSSQAPVAGTRTIEVTGAQARSSVEIPENTASASAEPFALRGWASDMPPASPPFSGFQAR